MFEPAASFGLQSLDLEFRVNEAKVKVCPTTFNYFIIF